MKYLISALLVIVSLSAAAGAETFTGIVTDDMCPNGDHSHMRMGSTDAECARACVKEHDAAFALYDGKSTYTLKGRFLEKFAGQRARVVGTLDAKTRTITVDSITAER
jgi:hypothetical protein